MLNFNKNKIKFHVRKNEEKNFAITLSCNFSCAVVYPKIYKFDKPGRCKL